MTHVFMSYSRRDAATVDTIVERLEKAGIDVWIDRQDIAAGGQWRAQIVEAIETASAFVLSLSPNAAASANVLKELNLVESTPDPFVLPVLLQEVKLPAEMRYQLAGVQHITYYLDPDKAYGELETAIRSRLKKVGKPGPEQCEVEIVIRGKTVKDFDEAKKQQLLALLADATGTPVEELAVTRIELGSLHVFVCVPQKTKYALKALALNRDRRLVRAGIERLRYVGEEKFISLKGRTPLPKPAWRTWLGIALGTLALAAIVIGLLRWPISGAADAPVAPIAGDATSTPAATFLDRPTRTPRASVTPRFTSTASHTPTRTPSPTRADTPTSTPYNGPPMAVARRDSVCRAGPGTQYPIAAGDMRLGEEAPIRQTDQYRQWVNAWVDRLGVTCWVASGPNGTVEVRGSLDGVPIYVPPPNTPTWTPSPTRTPTSFLTGTIKGWVWNDIDADGTADGGEGAFTGATLSLWPGACGAGMDLKTYTNEFGQYLYTSVPPGSYCVQVYTDTFIPTPINTWKPTTYPGTTVNVTLTPGSSITLYFGFVDAP